MMDFLCLFAISAISGNYSPNWGANYSTTCGAKGKCNYSTTFAAIAAKLFCALGASYAAMMV